MASPNLTRASPSPRNQPPLGLHINPARARASSTSSDQAQMWSTPVRPSSTTSFASQAPSPSPLDDDLFGTEKEPLISKRKASGQEERTSYSGGLSLSTTLDDVRKKGTGYWLQCLKIVVLFGITLLCCVAFVQNEELEMEKKVREIIATSASQTLHSEGYDAKYPIMVLTMWGPLLQESDNSNSTNTTHIQVDLVPLSTNETWNIQVNKSALSAGQLMEVTHKFLCPGPGQYNLSLHMVGQESGAPMGIPLVYAVHNLSKQVDNEIVYAALILLFVYVLIIFELVHRTLAAMLGALAALAVLSAINERPTTDRIIGWMEMETLMLLVGMMIIVAVISETGAFDYSALQAYKVAKGRVWPLVTLLCAFSAVVSAFLDNVTTILLIAPVTIRLCEVLNLEPRVILIAEVLFSNIGGTATAIGDPPNVIIVGALESEGITFTVFTAHLAIGVIFTTAVAYGFLRLFYRNMQQLSNPDPPDVAELNHEIEMWRRAASRLVVVTREETLMKALFLQKAVELENLLNKTLHRKRKAEIRDQNEQLRQLERDYQIKDPGLLLKCGAVLLVVFTLFFVYSFVNSIHISLGWIAVLGAMWLLVLANTSDLESILHKVEWSTLLFFAALFILMEALAELKLMEWIGQRMRDMILTVDTEYQLTAALVIIIWISALASSFIDNIPFTTAMIPVLRQLSEDKDVALELLPLVVALALGACFGGNGTLIGASANVVCAGIAERHGYTISFKQFFKVGFPMMLVTTLTATVYLLVCHSVIKWNSI